MSGKDIWEKNKEAGDIGENIIYPMLKLPLICWRGSNCSCVRWNFEATHIAENGKKVDADVSIKFDCTGCRNLREGQEPKCTQAHEIKTNIATNDRSLFTRTERSQNLYIEFIQNLEAYLRDNKKTEDDPLTGGKITYREGIGWWRKREEAFKNGQTTINEADWYHFYQPYDMWERIHLNRSGDNLKHYQSATDEQINKWFEDDSIPQNSILITQVPVEYCISVPGKQLKKLIEDRVGYPYNKNDYEMGWNINIKDVIPCQQQYITDGTDGRTAGIKEARISLIGEYVTRESKERIKGAITTLVAGKSFYTPAEIYGKKQTYATMLDMSAFKKGNNETFYTPVELLDFQVYKLQKYE